jgi:hypothetical protein
VRCQELQGKTNQSRLSPTRMATLTCNPNREFLKFNKPLIRLKSAICAALSLCQPSQLAVSQQWPQKQSGERGTHVAVGGVAARTFALARPREPFPARVFVVIHSRVYRNINTSINIHAKSLPHVLEHSMTAGNTFTGAR